MAWVATAIGGSAVVGGYFANKAAGQAADAANNATNAQLSMFNTVNDQNKPYREAGTTALSQLGAGTADGGQFSHQFNASDLQSNLAPNYQFQLGQGLGAVNNQMNLTGGVNSGNTLKAINDYAQNFAGNSYQNAFNNYQTSQGNIFNRLSTIAGLGSAANTTTGQAGTTAAGNMGNAMIAGGQAQAAGTMGVGNALSGGGNTLAMMNYLQPAGSMPSAQATADFAASSDRRLKKNIVRVGTHNIGIGLYEFDYISGGHSIGVMADEVEKVMPEAVMIDDKGFKMVNYTALQRG